MAGLWLIGIALYIGAITYIGWGDVAATVQSIEPGWIALGALIELGAIWLRALKWRIALGGGHDPVTQFFLRRPRGVSLRGASENSLRCC
jgi:uncharacterized membrane protein YbhN (UPF0104 family)